MVYLKPQRERLIDGVLVTLLFQNLFEILDVSVLAPDEGPIKEGDMAYFFHSFITALRRVAASSTGLVFV